MPGKRPLPRSRRTRGVAVEVERIGERLRTLRLAKRLTIARLAAQAGVPGSSISKIENGQLRPSLVHAINLAEALGENLGFLLGRYRDHAQPRAVVRAHDRDSIDYPEMGLALQDMSGRFAPGVLEARLGVLEPGAHSGIEPMTHEGEEMCFVLEGAIRYRIDDSTIDLGTREIVQFKSSMPHSWENAHPGRTRVLWVFSDGVSF